MTSTAIARSEKTMTKTTASRKILGSIFYQQGDVLLFPVAKLPAGTIIPPVNGRHVVLEGEESGHAHALAAHEGSMLLRMESGKHQGKLFLRLACETPITHEEHAAFYLPAGDYRVEQVQEWDYEKSIQLPAKD